MEINFRYGYWDFSIEPAINHYLLASNKRLVIVKRYARMFESRKEIIPMFLSSAQSDKSAKVHPQILDLTIQHYPFNYQSV